MYPYWFIGMYAALLRTPLQPGPTVLCEVEQVMEHVCMWQRGQVYLAGFAAQIAQRGALDELAVGDELEAGAVGGSGSDRGGSGMLVGVVSAMGIAESVGVVVEGEEKSEISYYPGASSILHGASRARSVAVKRRDSETESLFTLDDVLQQISSTSCITKPSYVYNRTRLPRPLNRLAVSADCRVTLPVRNRLPVG